MANFEKFTRGDYGLFAHCERKKDENGQYITFGNQRIDPTRTHLNYNMCPDGGEQRERLEARLSDPNVKCMNRADVVVYGSWCITLPTYAPLEDENGNIIYEGPIDSPRTIPYKTAYMMQQLLFIPSLIFLIHT